MLKYVDILVVTERKRNETFFGISKPCKLDRNKSGGGIMIFIRDTISSKILEKRFSK